MNDNDFLKELEEAEEVLSKPNPNLSHANNINTSNENENEKAMKLLSEMFGIDMSTLSNLNENQGEGVEDNLNTEDMKNFEREFKNTIGNLFENMNIPNQQSQTKESNSSSVPSQEDLKDNPFSKSYFEKSNNNNFDMNEIGKLLSGLTNLESFNENKDVNTSSTNNIHSDDQMKVLIKELMTGLISANLLKEPLTEMKNTVKDYLNNKQNQLSNEKVMKYEHMISLLSSLIDDLNENNINMDKIVNTFCELNDSTDFNDEIFQGIDSDLFKLLGNKC
jgi:predicted transcriptional regulator